MGRGERNGVVGVGVGDGVGVGVGAENWEGVDCLLLVAVCIFYL